MKPKIVIKYGNLIDPFFKEYVKVQYPDYVFKTIDEVKSKVELFKEEWQKHENIFIESIYQKTGLEFKRNHIDCFIVSATPRDMSAPLIIRSRYSPPEFIDALYHELLHIFLSDNKTKLSPLGVNESLTTKNHINTFALLKYLYLDVFNDNERLEKVIKLTANLKNVDYDKAWSIVNNSDYQDIIKLFSKNKVTPK